MSVFASDPRLQEASVARLASKIAAATEAIHLYSRTCVVIDR